MRHKGNYNDTALKDQVSMKPIMKLTVDILVMTPELTYSVQFATCKVSTQR